VDSLSREQLEQIRASMEAEHRKNMEALERVIGFLPTGANAATVKTAPTPAHNSSERAPESDEESQIDAMYALLTEDFTHQYTSRKVINALRAKGVALAAEDKQALATVGTSLNKLYKRGRIRRVKRGKGRQPSIYQGVAPMGIASVLESGVLTQ
jgi:phage I-like protein